MASVRQPIIINNKTLAAAEGVELEAHKILYIGRILADAPATDRGFYTDVKDDKATEALLGPKSEAFKNIKLAKSISGANRIDFIAIKDDNSDASGHSTPGTAKISIPADGVATADGDITIRVASRANYSYTVSIVKGETAEDILNKINGIIIQDLYLPLDLKIKDENNLKVLTFTTLHKGAFVNSYVLEVEGFDKIGISPVLDGFQGGSDGLLIVDNSIFDKISKIRYQEIVADAPVTYDMLETFLAKRWNVANQIKDGHAWMVKRDTFANLIEFGNSKNGFNVSVFYDKKETEGDYTGAYLGETEGAVALSMAQIEALQYTDGAILTALYPAMPGTNDLYGGMRQATLPYFNTLIPWMIPLRDDLGFSDEPEDPLMPNTSEIGKLKNVGYCEIGNNISNVSVLRGECRTFFKVDSAGNSNKTYRYVNTKWTASKFSEYLYLRQRQFYPKNRMSDISGQYDQTTSIASFINDLKTVYRECSEPEYGILLLRNGQAAKDAFARAIEDTVKFDFLDGEITDTQLLAFNGQVRNILNTLTPIFNINNEE